MQGQETWKFPPANLALNGEICDGILMCAITKPPEATLELSVGDLLCIDYCVPQDAKTAGGVAIGRTLLGKIFKARQVLARAGDDPLIAMVVDVEPDVIHGDDLDEALKHFAEHYTAPQEEKTNAKPRTSPNPSPRSPRSRTKRKPMD